MAHHTLLVISPPNDRQLTHLDRLPPGTSLACGESMEAFAALAPAADVILSWSGNRKALEAAFAAAPKVKWIHSRSAGLDGLLFPALIDSPVTLTNGRGVFSQSLGEFVMTGALYFAKDLPRMRRNQKAHRWEQFDIEEIRGQTMGIIGYGDIGRACAWRAKAMGMRVIAVRRRPQLSAGDEHVDEVFGLDRMLEVVPRCDYVVAAAPLTPETKALISDAVFAAMKPSAVIMNVGRGPVIDEAAMVRALESGRIRGAALDVFETEPLPESSPLWEMENVLLSPHCADHTATWLDDAMQFFLDNFERYAKGEPLENVVDKRAGY